MLLRSMASLAKEYGRLGRGGRAALRGEVLVALVLREGIVSVCPN